MGHSMLVRLLSRARVIGCNSRATRDTWIPKPLHSRVVVVHPGTPDFVRSSVVGGATWSSPTQGTPFRLLAVARLSPRKGLVRLIEAVESCAKDGLDVQLDLVGEGPEYSTLKSVVTLPGRVRFHQGVNDEDLAGLYSKSHLFALLPHRVSGAETWEGFGIVYLEAASKGLPILATQTGGVEESLSVQGSVTLSETCSSQEVAQALKALMADTARLNAMSSANIAWAESQAWSSRKPLIDDLLDRLGLPGK